MKSSDFSGQDGVGTSEPTEQSFELSFLFLLLLLQLTLYAIHETFEIHHFVFIVRNIHYRIEVVMLAIILA